MAQRVFVGVRLSPELAREIVAWEEKYLDDIPARWIAPGNLHVTLVPPWNTGDVEGVKRCLQTIRGRMSPFGVMFQRVMFGPRPRRPRLVRAVGPTPRALVDLRDGVEKALFGGQSLKALMLHVTLARFRPEHFSSFRTKRLDEKVHWAQDVDTVTLFASHLKPTGAEYEVLHSVSL